MEHPNVYTELREMTKRIPHHNPYYYNGKVMELVCERGGAISYGIYKDKNVSIAKTTFEPNTALGKHCHPEREVIFLLEGSIEITLIEDRRERKVTLRQHEMLEIEPFTRHYCENEERTVIIASTLPQSPFFPEPNGEEKENGPGF